MRNHKAEKWRAHDNSIAAKMIINIFIFSHHCHTLFEQQ